MADSTGRTAADLIYEELDAWLDNEEQRATVKQRLAERGFLLIERPAIHEFVVGNNRPESRPGADDGHGSISNGGLDAEFPKLPGVADAMKLMGQKEDVRRPEYAPWEIDLAAFGEVPVRTVLHSLELLGLTLETVQVRRA